MEFLELLIASGAYATGGLFMKYSQGLSRPLPTATFLLLFVLGASLQAHGMRTADLGMAYILVLGLEAGLALVLSLFVLRESFSTTRTVGIVMILVGVALLYEM